MKEIEEPSLNIATLRSYDVQPTSANVATSSRITQREFFRYNKKDEETREGRNEIRGGDDYIGVEREIVSTPVFVFSFFLEHLMINNSMIVKNNIMF